MWKCKNCSEQSENNFDRCWNCGYSRAGAPPPKEGEEISAEEVLPSGELLSTIVASSTASRSRNDIAEALTRRYKDAYVSASWLIRIGGVIKWVAVLLSILGFVVGAVFAATFGNVAFLIGLFSGLAIFIPIFVLGILISGQGQTHLATLDTAVNTSRHLSKEEVAGILFG